MEMFAQLPDDRDSIVEVGAQHDQGVRVEDDRLVLWEEEGHCHSYGQRDEEKIDQLTAMAGHLGYDQSTLYVAGVRQINGL
jgi:hypothetical protein